MKVIFFFKLSFLEAATLSRAIARDAGKGTGPVTFNSPLQSEDKVMTFSIKLNLFDLKNFFYSGSVFCLCILSLKDPLFVRNGDNI